MHRPAHPLRIVLLSALVATQVGTDCGPTLVDSVTPTDGSVITSFSFLIQVDLGPAADPGTLQVELNGVDVTGSLTGGPEIFSLTVNPGSPLLDQNQLVVRIQATGGQGPGGLIENDFSYLPPKARAQVVSNPADCITGPLAHCTVGDYLLSNSEARFAVQKPEQRDLHFVSTYGGNLIDAELVVGGVPQGNDNFAEFQPTLNIESVINAQTAEIVNDGQDGTPAIVRTCGPDDLLDDINPSSAVAGLGVFPASADDADYDITGCTTYTLSPQERTVEVVTTIESTEPVNLPLYPGDFINAGGELEQLTPLSPSALVGIGQAGVGELFANWGVQLMGFFGYGEAEGVDYAIVTQQPPAIPGPSSTFTQSGVSYMLHGQAIPLVLGFGAPSNFLLPANGSATFKRWFSVGDGSAGNAVQAFADENALAAGTLSGCVEDASGDPLAGARVVAARDLAGGITAFDVVRSHWVTGADGCYEGRVPAGSYRMAAAKQGYPYEGGGATPVGHVVSVSSGGSTVQDFTLPETGRLRIEAVDHLAAPVPARVGVVGSDPSPEPTLLASVLSAGDTRSNLFYDLTADGFPTAVTRTAYTDAAGTVEFDVEPGSYWVAVSRGTEWSAHTEQVTISAGSTTTVNAQIAHVLDTTGFVSSDYHVHMIDSPDSRVSRSDRIRSFAGEGVDNIIATDHAYVTDLMPQIAAMGFGSFVHATAGEEITSFDYGHFNAYPQGPDSSRVQTKGSTDHSGAAPPGEDFPSFGNFCLTPAEIEAEILGDPDNAGLDTVVQINHISSHFDPLRINTALTPPASQLTAGQPQAFRLDPTIPNFYNHFPALELWNGNNIAHQNEFLVGRIGIWMNLLNQGLFTTAISDTDTHELTNLRSGGARSWTPASSDAPGSIVDPEIGRGVYAGKVIGGQGLFVTTRLLATDGSGGVAQLGGLVGSGTPPGSLAAGTLVSVTNNAVDLEIRVQGPTWAPYDRIEIYRNASTQVTRRNPNNAGGVPVLFTALPTTVLTAGAGFTVSNVPVNGSARLETLVSVPLAGLAEDEWIAVLVKGTQGTSPPMFPVMPSDVSVAQNPNLAALMNVTAAENGIRALGVANALYVDVDGNGVFDPPGVSVVP